MGFVFAVDTLAIIRQIAKPLNPKKAITQIKTCLKSAKVLKKAEKEATHYQAATHHQVGTHHRAANSSRLKDGTQHKRKQLQTQKMKTGGS